MKKDNAIVVKAEDLPRPVYVIGKDGRKKEYMLVPTRKAKGAQLCSGSVR